MRALTAIVLMVAVSSPAGAEDYFPICAGSVWEYISLDTGVDYVTECVGTEVVWGIECAVLENSGPGDEGLLQYWYKNEEGAAVIRGWFRTIGGYGRLFEPGIQMMSAAPFLGEQWCSPLISMNCLTTLTSARTTSAMW